MKYIKSMIFFILIACAIIYIKCFRSEIPLDKVSIADSLIATFVATLLSFIVGIFLYEYQQKMHKKSQKERLIGIINAQSKDIISVLSSEDRMTINFSDKKSKSVLMTMISPLAHEEAGKSGDFNVFITEKMFKVSRHIRLYNLQVEHLLGLIRVNGSGDYLEHAIDNLNSTTESIIKLCQLIDEKIEKV